MEPDSISGEGRVLWAIQGVTFSIEKGDVVGILGLNGAGKSTLLKILSRVTEPTEGEVVLRGRIASLLEVGTGFHPDLSGRENVFLNGAMLGMRRAEVESKFDEIVEFAEVKKFIDTPVKRYSSGMYVRLAFSVAAHLEAEIMIIDEVLAVGDYAFQAKCIERLRALTASGKTILVVSHNLYTMQTLCRNGLLLRNGRLELCGSIEKVIAHFRRNSIQPHRPREGQAGDNPLQIVTVQSVMCNDSYVRAIESNGPLDITIVSTFFTREDCVLHFGVSIKGGDGTYISGLSTFLEGSPRMFVGGTHRVEIKVPKFNAASGSYKIAFAVMNASGVAVHYADDDACEVFVVRPFQFDGAMNLEHQWRRNTCVLR